MTELNGLGPTALCCEDGIFSICDTSHFSTFDRVNPAGFAVQVKPSKTLNFASYSNSLDAPFRSHLFTADSNCVRQFFVKRQRGELPRDMNYDPATTSLIAGLLANEAVKALTHYVLPMTSPWYLWQRPELAGKTPDLKALRTAVIGVAATGCEVAKLLVLSGIRQLALVDPDHIETTNLNRQVLFTDNDVGRNKAIAAADRLITFRPDITMTVHQHFVNSETRPLFNDKWFKQFDAVFAMVDSFAAREEIGRRCAPSKVPMFTGGIDRKSADWQCVIPDVTCRYDVQTFGEEADPMLSCTLKFFRIVRNIALNGHITN
jgi:hypothetical protein